jgi:hypothetical protein
MERPRPQRNIGVPYRDALPQVAQSLPRADYSRVAKAVGGFLLNWNWSFYRSERNVDYGKLEKCIKESLRKLVSYRDRSITSFDVEDEAQTAEIKTLFVDFLNATIRVRDGARSPVSVAKALHILAPEFFPPWDNDVAIEYQSIWGIPEASPGKYLGFTEKVQQGCKVIVASYMAENDGDYDTSSNAVCQEARQWHGYHPSLLKLIDEFNMARFSDWR